MFQYCNPMYLILSIEAYDFKKGSIGDLQAAKGVHHVIKWLRTSVR